MDEYFCPNCGATLNDQYGFAPSNGTWTCTECGKLLMDDDVYKGDSFEGVAWYCDNCGSLLNRQSGFSDSYSSWTCTACGHRNGTTGEDIKTPCPNCGSFLEDQFCFSEYSDDWTCTDCGAHLHHSYSGDPFSIVDDEDEHTGDSSSGDLSDALARLLGVAIDAGVSAYSQKRLREREEAERQAEAERIRREKEKERKEKNTLRKKRAKAFLFKGKKIEVRYNCETLVGENVSFVATTLAQDAFSNIKTVPIKDIYKGSYYKVGQVEQIEIAGSSTFRKGEMIPYDAEIVITYHEKREIAIPFSEHSLRKMNYVLAGDKLQELGFTEIYEKPIRDLVTGWVKKDGAVEKITVGEVYPFKKNSVFPYDVEITIEYHTFKKK